MNKIIFKNIATVSAIFIVAFSIMLVTNYFQTRGITPLQIEVMETLKQLNDENANNPVLQEQIRQLDLLSRKAYFVQHDRLMTGIYILLGMLAVFLVCIRYYFAGSKDIPDKDVDPVDEWAIKTKARRYVVWGVSGLAATALVLSLINLTLSQKEKVESPVSEFAEIQATEEINEEIPAAETTPTSETVETSEMNVAEATKTSEISVTSETPAVETVAQPVVSKVTHNAFRGNNSNGISAAKGVPVKWDLAKGTNIAWKCDIPRIGMSSPIINGNRVFITGADEQARELYCYDLTTGKILWTLVATGIPGSPSKMPELYYDNMLAASTAATNGNHVCAIFATGDLICADMNGNRLWAKNLGVPDNHYGYASSLLMFGNLLIIQYDNLNNPRVMALDIATGAERWSKARTERYPNWGSPSIVYVNNTPQLVLIGCPGVIAYNPNNGQQLWRLECLSSEPAASIASANGIVFTATEYAKLTAINAADGTVLWEDNFHLPDTSSPVATSDNVYIATGYGVFAAFDAKTGEFRSEHEFRMGFYSSPVIADGKIYLFDQDGKVHVFTADNEFRLLESFDTGEKTSATPAFTDGKIVVRTEKSIYCVSVN